MAKASRLTKLKSLLKKLNSFGRRHHSMAASSASSRSSSSFDGGGDSQLYPVYVGLSRRCYLVTLEVITNPVFRELVDRSGGDDLDSVVTIGCEVVMFEHLLWMLENADHHDQAHHELADYYAW